MVVPAVPLILYRTGGEGELLAWIAIPLWRRLKTAATKQTQWTYTPEYRLGVKKVGVKKVVLGFSMLSRRVAEDSCGLRFRRQWLVRAEGGGVMPWRRFAVLLI